MKPRTILPINAKSASTPLVFRPMPSRAPAPVFNVQPKVKPAEPLQKPRGGHVKSNYANLDMLRSLAVLSVVAAHLWRQGVAFGICTYDAAINQFLHNLSFTGVMFFFVHTCLVLMLSMHRAPAEHRGRSFLIRRAFRIYPLCWATILVVLATGLSDLPPENLSALGWSGIVANLLLIQNMTRDLPSVIGPLWSLPWEVQMYLLLPLFFLVLRRFERIRTAIFLWLGATLLAVAATAPGMPRFLHAAVFPPMFIGGMVAYRLLARGRADDASAPLPGWAWPVFVLSLFAVQGFVVGPGSFESPAGAATNACICLVLALGVPSFHQLRASAIVWPAQQVAKYSYGIYLLHVPALIFVGRFLPGLPVALKILLFVVITALASYASFHLIEDPLIRAGKRLAEAASQSRQATAAEVRPMRARTVGAAYAPVLAWPDKGARTPLVSIITPVYNAVRWLPETLASVEAQTLGDWEHILIDDGSTDGSLALLEAAARRDPRVHVLRSKRNSGPAAARNQGLDASRGRFIAFLDADDLWHPEKLARSVEWISSHGYSFIYHDYRHISQDGAQVGALITGPEELNLRTLHTRRGTGGCLSVVIDRERVHGFHFPRSYRYLHEDFCGWLSLIERGHMGHRLPADLGRYRLSAESRSANKFAGAMHTWRIYREISNLPLLRAAFWWMQYAWNGYWLHRYARPR